MAVGTVMTLTSCDDFLDKMPDNRTEINSIEKVTKLLVSAYPESNFNYLCEMASDNAMDKTTAPPTPSANDSNRKHTSGRKSQERATTRHEVSGTTPISPSQPPTRHLPLSTR